MKKLIIITFAITATVLFLKLRILLGPGINQARRTHNFSGSSRRESNDTSFINTQQIIKTHSSRYNSTYLWSMRFADENYFRLARLLPCRTVEYQGGSKVDKIDSCDHSPTNEYSIKNTLQAQKWIYEHQYPQNCTNKTFAVIQKFAWSGFGSTIHQIAWAFGTAIAQDRIAIYRTPENWLYGDCDSGNPDCIFLPISNCSVPSTLDGQQTVHIDANLGHWPNPIHPRVFQNRTFNWYRAQLVFYLMRYKPQTLAHVQNNIAQYFKPPSIDLHHPYIAIYVRRSDKVKSKEMSQAYTLKQYFDLFHNDARRANIKSVYINSEDGRVFNEFAQINKEIQGYYNLLSVDSTKNVVFSSLLGLTKQQRGKIVLEFLCDLFIEVNADLHVGTLTSNWCRLVDELRLVLGKTIPYYTPENRYFIGMKRRK